MLTNQPQILTNSFLKILKVSVAYFSDFPIFPEFPGFSRIFLLISRFFPQVNNIGMIMDMSMNMDTGMSNMKTNITKNNSNSKMGNPDLMSKKKLVFFTKRFCTMSNFPNFS